MKFDQVQELLGARNWRVESDRLESPSGGFGFDRETFDRDIRAVYDPAARRVYSFGHPPESHELHVLLLVLSDDPVLTALNNRVTSLQGYLQAFAEKHSMTISFWNFGHPSVRATALHPAGGVAVIEGMVEHPTAIDLNAYHWIDDPEGRVRRSRRQEFPGITNAAELPQSLTAAVTFLLASPDLALFRSVPLSPADAKHGAYDTEYWSGFSILR
jgi:hypothetical protein